jgi:hypothetical protein
MENNILGTDNILNKLSKDLKRAQELTGNDANIVDLIQKMPELPNNTSIYQWKEETNDNLLNVNKRIEVIWKTTVLKQ